VTAVFGISAPLFEKKAYVLDFSVAFLPENIKVSPYFTANINGRNHYNAASPKIVGLAICTHDFAGGTVYLVVCSKFCGDSIINIPDFGF
jgi:hypothetical protein